LTAEPEVVDIVINLVFQRLSSPDGSSLLPKKKENKNRGNLAQRNKVGWPTYLAQRQLETLFCLGN